MVLFNLIPGYPLDGGRVLRAIVWAITGNMGRSTIIAANAGRFFAFLLIFVNRGHQTIGLITLHRIKEVPRPEWTTTSAAKAMLPLEQLRCIGPDAELWSALQMMDRNGVNQMPVIGDQHVVGMLSREDAITFLRTLQEFGTPPGTVTET